MNCILRGELDPAARRDPLFYIYEVNRFYENLMDHLSFVDTRAKSGSGAGEKRNNRHADSAATGTQHQRLWICRRIQTQSRGFRQDLV